jgi:hypothetical protein
VRTINLVAAILAALLSSAAGAATLGECIVAQFTPQGEAVIAKEYLATGPEGVSKASVPDAIAVAGKCLPKDKGRTPDDILRISSALAGHWLKAGAEASLGQRHKVTAAQLDAAWKSLAPAHRARFSRAGKSDAAAADAMMAFILAVRPDIPAAKLNEMRGPDRPEPSAELKPLVPLITDLTAYGIGRGMQESPELIDVSLPESPSH